jgi:hypothetical protein
LSVPSNPSTSVPNADKVISFTNYLISLPHAKETYVDIIHSFRNLSYDRPVISSTDNSPDGPVSFQYSLLSLKSSSSCLAFSLVFQSLISFLLPFLQKRVSEGSSYARCEKSS